MTSKEAEELVIRYLPELHKGIASPVSLAVELLSCGVIPRKVYDDAISYDGSIPTERKIHAICDALLKSVAIKPTLLVEFVEVASDNSPGMSDVCARIKREPLYGEVITLFSLSLSLSLSPPAPPSCPPHSGQSKELYVYELIYHPVVY